MRVGEDISVRVYIVGIHVNKTLHFRSGVKSLGRMKFDSGSVGPPHLENSSGEGLLMSLFWVFVKRAWNVIQGVEGDLERCVNDEEACVQTFAGLSIKKRSHGDVFSGGNQ